MVDMLGLDKEQVIETLINDDIYILLEELNKWGNKNIFISTYKKSIEGFQSNEISLLEEILKGDFEILDSNYKTNKNIIRKFLTNMYPSENINKKTDVTLLEYMEEIQNAYKKYIK